MGKIGLAFASLFLATTMTGLGFTSYYMANHSKFNENFKEKYSNTAQAQTAFSYGDISENLENAADSMGNYIVKDGQVIVIENPDKNETLRNLDNAIFLIKKMGNQDKYFEKILDTDIQFLSFDMKNVKYYAEDIQKLKNETKKLSDELEILAINSSPNYLTVKSELEDSLDKKSSCYGLLTLSSIGVICTGIWTACEAEEFVGKRKNYSSYSKRRIRNKI